MKKLISSLLALAMLLSLMPLSVLATEEETQARNPVVELYVGTVNALETPQGDGWSFDAESGVLTLNNCTLTESMLHVETDEWGSDRYDAMIYVKGDLTIELIGTNSVERVIEEAPTDYTNYYAICNSIYCPSDWEMPGSLTFVGDGNLTVGVAVSRDYLSEDGYSTNEAWEYLEFSSGIASWNYTDLSGLYGGGWMDIYGGVYGIEAPYIARAFANYPTFGDNCIVTAYQDVDGTIENENGYNWNNNDAWRMKVVTGNAILKDNGQLILMDTDSASGVGWTWENQVLTLSEGTEVKAVDLRSRVGSAKLVLTGDVTLDGTDLGTDADWNYISAIETRCDLEIDAGEHTLTFTGETGGITSYLSDVLISGGTVADTGTGYIGVLGGDLTVQDTTLRLGCGIALSEGYDADNNTVPAGAMLVKDSVLVLDDELCSYGSLTVTGSDVTVTGGYYAMRGSEFLTVQDSILDLNGYNYALFSYGNVTVDNCDLNLIGEVCVIGRYNYYYEGDDESIIPDASCFQLLNMDITQPEGCTVRVVENVYEYYTMYEVQVVDSAGNPATTLKATAAGDDAHEHSYTQGVCSVCGKKQTFTVTWYNWDGTVLEVDTVEYGETPEYNGPTPTRTGEGYDYTFYAWGYNESGSQTGTPGPATANQHWYAKFTSVAHKHYLIFMDSDGVTELGRYERSYNQRIIITTANLFAWAGEPTKDCYTLSGWYRADGLTNSNFYMPDHDVVFVAIWDGPDHTWVEADCDTPKTCSVCGETEGEALGHSYTEGVCACGKKQTFTITWKNDDGTVLEVDTVEYGDHPEYNGPTPTKTGGEGYDYTFYAWSNGIQYTNVENVIVTQDWTYTAGYNKIAHKHDLIFMSGDVELTRKEIAYSNTVYQNNLNGYAGNPTKDCCTLSGWAYADGTTIPSYFQMPDEDVVLYAIWDGPNHTLVNGVCSVCGLTEGTPEHTHVYAEGACACGKKQTFTITWKNDDGTVLEVDTVEYGDHPEYNGPTPTKTGVGYDYTFRGWSNGTQYTNVENVTVTQDWTYTAGYNKTAHVRYLIFMDSDGVTEISRYEVYYGKSISGITTSWLTATAGTPKKDCYTLTGWERPEGLGSSYTVPDYDPVYVAIWDGPNHTWEGEETRICSRCGVTEGGALPEHTHIYLEGVCSCGKKLTFTITWKNWDGTVLETDTVEYGVKPEYNGSTPTKEVTGQTCTFAGWGTVNKATADMTYTATFYQTANKYNVILMDGDTELGRHELAYDAIVSESSLPEYAGNPTKPCCTIAGWQYADGTAFSSTRMTAEDMVLYIVWDGPNHTWAEATCEAPKTCSVCGETEGEALGHSWVEATCEAPKTCSGCGLTEGEALPDHNYVDGVCACGKIQTFTITWVNWDGTVLETDTVEYGTVPTYDGATPTRPNVGYDFNFYGWALSSSSAEVTIGAATQDRTYYAKYTSTIHKHDLIFMDGDLELAREEFDYNKYIYASGLNSYAGNHFEKDCCTHTGWAYADGTSVASFWMPDEDLVIYAVWEGPNHTLVDGICSVCGLTEGMPEHTHFFVEGVCACGKVQTFTVTWTNWDGTVLEVDTVEYGQIPEYNGETPIKTGVGYDYTFSCWYKGNYPATFEAVTSDLTFKAYYTGVAHKHYLIFMDGDVELARKEFDYNKHIYSSGLNASKACYTLTGWAYADGTAASSFWMPDEDVVLYAVWDGPNHTWVDATCEAPKTCSVCGVTEGEALEHTYTEGVCSGCGAIQTFTITWVNWDGTVLEVDTVEYGTVPTYDGATPIRPNVGYDFTFYGWALSASGAETTPGAATQDRTYYAKYTSTVHYHDIIFMDEDMVTELGRYETYYDKLIATSWLTTASGITVPPCYTAWWCYEDGSMPEESFRMPDHDVVLYIMWEGPGHVYDGVITTEPTCTEYGVMTYTCISCGDSYTDSLWPKGHSYAGVVTEPTCTEGGYTTYTCSDCGDSYVGDQVAAHGHDYCNYVTTEPTCTTDGYTTYSCMFCGDSYVTDIVEGGHKFGVIYITNATCTEYGSSSGTCIVCGELVTDDAYEAPLGHDYIAEITQAPSCSAAGVMTYTCTRCADSYTEEIAALTHDFSTGAQCTTCGTDAEASVTIGGIVTYYATAYEASTAVQYCTEEDNALIVLLKDIVLEKSFDRYISLKNCVCTLDLNGKTVYGNSQNYEPIRVRFDSDVTIVDSVGTGKVTGGANTFGVVYSTLTVNGGTFIGTQYGASSSGDSTVIINGGTFEGKYGGCFYDCEVIINGGTFTGTEYGLYVRITGGDTSTTTINGGTISGTVCDIYVCSAESTVTLSVGEDGIGATFPGGISVDGTDLAKRPLNALLGEGMTYWCNGSAISFIDDVYDFSGGDVSVRKICQHSYENGYCTACGAKDPNYVEIVKPTVTLKYPTLAFEDEILYNVYFNVDNMTSVKEMGLMIFADRNENGTAADASETIPGFVINADGSYTVHSNGIPAKMLGDAVYFKIYAQLNDGSYVYSGIAGYHAVLYANTVLKSDAASAKAKALVVAMLNYGAAAQVDFDYKTDSLMNAGLTADHQALIEEYNESMVAAVPSATSKAGSFVNNGGYSDLHPTVSFEGAFSINYYFTPKYTPDNGVINFYYWNFDAFNAAETLTPENATGTVQMTSDGNVYTNPVEGIAAKQIDEPVYVAGLYTNGGTTYTTPVIGYSLGNYCKNLAANGNAFGAATAVYGFYAKAYFAD